MSWSRCHVYIYNILMASQELIAQNLSLLFSFSPAFSSRLTCFEFKFLELRCYSAPNYKTRRNVRQIVCQGKVKWKISSATRSDLALFARRRETNGDDSRAEGVYRKEESEEMRKTRSVSLFAFDLIVNFQGSKRVGINFVRSRLMLAERENRFNESSRRIVGLIRQDWSLFSRLRRISNVR